MRLPTALILATLAAPALVLPAMAQNNSGLNGVIRNLDQSLNPQQRQDARRPDDYSDRSNHRFRNRSDMEAEQRRLDDQRRQINEAQRRLDQEQRQFDRDRSDYERD